MKRRSHLCAFLLSFCLIVVAGCTETERTITQKRPTIEKKFVIAGSGSNLPITDKLVQKYNQKNRTKIEVPNSIDSSGAINAVKAGAIEIGLVSREMNDKEKTYDLIEVPYARVGIIVGVNTDVPDKNLTYNDLVDIYLGKKNTWQNGKMIVVIAREKGDSSNQVLIKGVPGFKEALKDSQNNKRWQVSYTDADSVQLIMSTSSAIGFTDTSAILAQKLNIKPLLINGTAPSIENLKNDTYKLYKDLYFIYKKPLSPQAQKYLEYVYSPEGEKIIELNGAISLKEK